MNGLVVSISYQTWSHILGGQWPGWRACRYIYYSPGLTNPTYALTRYKKRVAAHPWPLDLISNITSHTYMLMTWWFANPAKYWPIASVVCGLDGWHPSVCVTSQACEIFPMYSQDMSNVWQPINVHLYLTSYPTPPRGWLGVLQMILSVLRTHFERSLSAMESI